MRKYKNIFMNWSLKDFNKKKNKNTEIKKKKRGNKLRWFSVHKIRFAFSGKKIPHLCSNLIFSGLPTSEAAGNWKLFFEKVHLFPQPPPLPLPLPSLSIPTLIRVFYFISLFCDCRWPLNSFLISLSRKQFGETVRWLII